MSDKERAKKLAAAKKKLKEYQTKEKQVDVDSSDASEYGGGGAGGDKQSVSHQEEIDVNKSLNNKMESLHSNNNTQQQQQQQININASNIAISEYFKTSNDDPMFMMMTTMTPHTSEVTAATPAVAIAATNYQLTNAKENSITSLSSSASTSLSSAAAVATDKLHHHNLNAVEILITEKAALTAELTKQQTLCKEKILESEELALQLQISTNRNKLLEDEIKELHSQNEIFKSDFNTLNAKFAAQTDEFDKQTRKYHEITEHLDELKRELHEEHKKNSKLEEELKQKCCDLELCHIRINQISDEASLATDNRVEILTQTKFMYEQQIRDLQAMVQQLTTERDQANQQYQNYVQQLNKQIASISEKNLELNMENERLANRERNLIEHVGGLEKQIQDNIAKQECFKEKINQQSSGATATDKNTISMTTANEEKLKYEKQIHDLQEENKKLQTENDEKEKKLTEIITLNVNVKDERIKELEEKIEMILSEKPNSVKLLATMESDKVAASRAIQQNEELKTQLELVEQKLIQVTNDKVELVNQLDSEQYTNRKIRENYEEMEQNLSDIKEKLHFKDEEMIRLTHEHSELNKIILQLQQQLDRLKHYEVTTEYNKMKQKKATVANNGVEEGDANSNAEEVRGEESKNHHHNHDDEHDHSHYGSGHVHSHEDDHTHSHGHSHNHGDNEHTHGHGHSHSHGDDIDHNNLSHTNENRKLLHEENHSIINGADGVIPTHEAMEKLQERFKKLMLEVADLTDEKQRLEHLVLQLQSETETIGEYITLYQNQRRMLKQREIEKATQLRILVQEREEMRDKIINLTQLVENLVAGYELNQNHNADDGGFKGSSNLHHHSYHNLVSSDTVASDNANDNSAHSEEIPPMTISTTTDDNDDDDNNKINYDVKSLSQQHHNRHHDDAAAAAAANLMELQQSNPILAKIHNIIAEIKQKEENLETNLKFTPSVDHCACCSGKFETI